MVSAIGMLRGSRLESGLGLCKRVLGKQVGASLPQSARQGCSFLAVSP